MSGEIKTLPMLISYGCNSEKVIVTGENVAPRLMDPVGAFLVYCLKS